MTASNFAMRMLITHSDFPTLYKQATSDIPYERNYAMQKLSELHDELFELVLKFDYEQDFDYIICSFKDIHELVMFLASTFPYGEDSIHHIKAIADCQVVHPGNPTKTESYLAWHNQD